jgi:hypothetical protein
MSPPSGTTTSGLELEIETEQGLHRRGFRLIDDQGPILEVVAERDQAAHPQAFLLGGGDLVADPLAGDLIATPMPSIKPVDEDSGVEKSACAFFLWPSTALLLGRHERTVLRERK